MAVKMYRVGGCVRDKLMGFKSKDIDYSVEAPSYSAMREAIVARGGQIFLETPEYLTIRAKVPNLGAADFVLCRKDGQYSDGRHPDLVEPGTLTEDLARRDFTMNAIAEAEDGTLFDPFGGQADIKRRIIKCVGSAQKRFEEDYLRMLRAIRFTVTKKMIMDDKIVQCLQDPQMVKRLLDVSVERVYEEMMKAFKHDTLDTLVLLETFDLVRNIVLGPQTGLWLKPTLEKP